MRPGSSTTRRSDAGQRGAVSGDHPGPQAPAGRDADFRFRVLQLSLLVLRAGPLLIFLILVLSVSAITPVFHTWRNIGNVLQQTSVISVLAIGQLLVIITRGIDLSVGSTVAMASVSGYL